IEPGLYEVSGIGATQKDAFEEASINLSYGLNTKVSSKCFDIDSSNFQENSIQSCKNSVRSRSEIGYTPIISVDKCSGFQVVRIRYDARPLIDRMDLLSLDLKHSEELLIDQRKLIPFSVLLRNIRSGKLRLRFDSGNRIWAIVKDSQTMWLTTKDFINQVRWAGCEQEDRFEFLLGANSVKAARHEQNVRVKISNKNKARFASLWELDSGVGAELIGSNLNPENGLNNNILTLDFANSLIQKKIFISLLLDERLSIDGEQENFTLDQFLEEVVLNELVSGNGQFCAYTVYNKEAL
ncbi:hypothetical protein, partial [Oleiphilus sp. HI0117]